MLTVLVTALLSVLSFAGALVFAGVTGRLFKGLHIGTVDPRLLAGYVGGAVLVLGFLGALASAANAARPPVGGLLAGTGVDGFQRWSRPLPDVQVDVELDDSGPES